MFLNWFRVQTLANVEIDGPGEKEFGLIPN